MPVGKCARFSLNLSHTAATNPTHDDVDVAAAWMSPATSLHGAASESESEIRFVCFVRADIRA